MELNSRNAQFLVIRGEFDLLFGRKPKQLNRWKIPPFGYRKLPHDFIGKMMDSEWNKRFRNGIYFEKRATKGR